MLRERWCNRKRGKCTLQHFKVRYQTKNIIPPTQLPKIPLRHSPASPPISLQIIATLEIAPLSTDWKLHNGKWKYARPLMH